MPNTQDTEPVDRELYFEAALIWLTQLSVGVRDSHMQQITMLRLGFALGSKDNPQDLIPVVAVKAAEMAREKAREYREQQAHNLAADNATEAIGRAIGGFGAYGGGGLW